MIHKNFLEEWFPIDKIKSLFKKLTGKGSSGKEDVEKTISPAEQAELQRKQREANLMAIKGTPLEKLVRDFMETMKTVQRSSDRKKLKPYTFSQSKALINLVQEMITYDLVDCEVYKSSYSKIAKFFIQVNKKRYSKEYVLLVRPLPSSGEWKIYSFEEKSKILEVLKTWSDFLKAFPDQGIMKSSSKIPLEIGVALMQMGEDDSAVDYLKKTITQDQAAITITDEILAAKVCLSILQGKAS